MPRDVFVRYYDGEAGGGPFSEEVVAMTFSVRNRCFIAIKGLRARFGGADAPARLDELEGRTGWREWGGSKVHLLRGRAGLTARFVLAYSHVAYPEWDEDVVWLLAARETPDRGGEGVWWTDFVRPRLEDVL